MKRTEYLVQVAKGSGTLTYSYGSPLRVGDRVMCPANEYSGPFIATVTELGSDYEGSIRSLLCRVADDRKRA